MTQMPAVQGGQQLPALPAHLRAAAAAGTSANADLKAGLSVGISVPRLSTKGGKFRVVIDGVEKLVTANGEPVTYLNVVIVGANKGRYKTFFGEKTPEGNWVAQAYDPDGEAQMPTCYSFDGERPSPFAPVKQCESCGACPQNVFGSHVTQQGKDTRACSDGKLLAVIPLATVKNKVDPVANPKAAMAFMIKVPPTGLSRSREDRKADPTNNTSLVEYLSLLDRYPTGDGAEIELPVTSVVTKIFLDHNAEYPLPRFKLQGFLEPDEIAYVEKRRGGEDIRALVTEEGRRGQPAAAPAPRVAAPAPQASLPPPAATAPPPPAQTAAQPPQRPAPAPRPAAPPPAPPAPVSAAPAAPQGDPDNVSFGDEGQPAPAAPQVTPGAPRGRGRPPKATTAPASPAAPAAPPQAAPAPHVPAPVVNMVDDNALDEIAGMFSTT